jgi:hypothetical protein
MAREGSVLGMAPNLSKKFNRAKKNPRPCLHCALGAFPQFPVGHELRESRNFEVGEYFHIDWIGPFEKSIGDNRYALIANDDGSSYVFDFYIKTKDPEAAIIPALKRLIDKLKVMGKTPMLFHFDADTVFESENVQTFLDNEHIGYGYSEPGEHRHSGAIESIARVLQDGMRKLLAHSGAPNKFWAYAMHQVVYIHNRIISDRFSKDKHQRYMTPLEILTGEKPDASKIVPWGVACVSRIPNPEQLGKLQLRGRPGVTLGNAPEYNNATYVYNLRTKRVVVSKDVRVDETRMGFTGRPIDWFESDENRYSPDDRDEVEMPLVEDENENFEEVLDEEIDPTWDSLEEPGVKPGVKPGVEPAAVASTAVGNSVNPQIKEPAAATFTEVEDSGSEQNEQLVDAISTAVENSGSQQSHSTKKRNLLRHENNPKRRIRKLSESQAVPFSTKTQANPYARVYNPRTPRSTIRNVQETEDQAELHNFLKKKISTSMILRITKK